MSYRKFIEISKYKSSTVYLFSPHWMKQSLTESKSELQTLPHYKGNNDNVLPEMLVTH